MISIGIDARFLTHPQHGGFKTYTKNLIKALSKIDRENRYILFTSAPEQKSANVEPLFGADTHSLPENFEIVPVQSGGGAVGVLLREQIMLPLVALRSKVDVLHLPAATGPMLNGCPTVITIHDTIWNRPKASQDSSFRRTLMHHYYRQVTLIAASHAKAVVTVSEASRQDIVAELGIPPEQVHVTHEAASAELGGSFGPGVGVSETRHFGIDRKYVLGLGSADPRKNVAGLLKIFSLLPHSVREEHQLVLVWAHQLIADSMSQLACELGVSSQVINLFRLTDQELTQIYRNASAFVFPSLSEGFGLPLLEAMSCGTPVIAAQNSSIPEVAGAAALYYPTLDYAQGSKLLHAVLMDQSLASNMKHAGFERTRLFSWEKCARETRRVYEIVAQS